MLDVDQVRSKRLLDPIPEVLETRRPGRVVVGDDDRRGRRQPPIRKKTTSPSRTRYSRPSTRSLPADRSASIEPASTSSSTLVTSARMNFLMKSVWMTPGRDRRRRPVLAGPGPNLGLARGEVGDQPARLPDGARHRRQPRLGETVGGAVLGGVGRVELRQLHLERRGDDRGLGPVGEGVVLDRRTGGRRVGNVGDVHHRLDGDREERGQRLAGGGVELHRAQWLPPVEVGLGASENFRHCRGPRLVDPRLFGGDLEPLLDRGEVSEHHVEAAALEVTGGVGTGAEAASHGQDHVRLPRGGDLLGPAAGRGVRDPDLGVHLLFRDDRGFQPVEPLVGHVHHPDATRAAAAGEGIEKGRLAGAGRPDDGY